MKTPQKKWPHQESVYSSDTKTQLEAWNRTVDALSRIALGVEALATEAAKQTALLKSIDGRLQVLEANQE